MLPSLWCTTSAGHEHSPSIVSPGHVMRSHSFTRSVHEPPSEHVYRIVLVYIAVHAFTTVASGSVRAKIYVPRSSTTVGSQ